MKLLPILLLTGCGYFAKHESKEHSSPVEELREKYEQIYQEVESELEPVTAWPSNNDCDGLLWAGLACSVGFRTEIQLAEYSPGEMHRRPYNSCYADESGDVGSKSTISRDMLTGYMSCLWTRKDLAAFQRLADYGEKHDWIMGKPSYYVSRVYLGNNLQGLLGRFIHVLSGGDDSRWYRRLPPVYQPVGADYEKHIQVQGILLNDAVTEQESVNQEMLARLTENAASNPLDPLFSAALGRFTGNQEHTLNLLLNPDTPCPSYARGEKPDVYCKLIWLQAARIVIESSK